MSEKSILISIKPEWCKLITEGKKTIEVRKTRPKIDTPFKCYICRQGTVIGGFTCDRIYQYTTTDLKEGVDISDEDMTSQSGLTKKELSKYEHSTSSQDYVIEPIGLFGWHISDLFIYPESKDIREFGARRSPQSWQYVKTAESEE